MSEEKYNSGKEFAFNGALSVIATPDITKNWGLKYSKIVAELPFDLQAYLPENCEDTVWTPVIGTIRVFGDVSPGGSLWQIYQK